MLRRTVHLEEELLASPGNYIILCYNKITKNNFYTNSNVSKRLFNSLVYISDGMQATV